jgi:hypothetical protein
VRLCATVQPRRNRAHRLQKLKPLSVAGQRVRLPSQRVKWLAHSGTYAPVCSAAVLGPGGAGQVPPPRGHRSTLGHARSGSDPDWANPYRLARDLPERAPRQPWRSPTDSYTSPRLSSGNTMRHEAAGRFASWWLAHGMQEARGSNPLSSTSHNASTTPALAGVCQQLVSRSLAVSPSHSERCPDCTLCLPGSAARWSSPAATITGHPRRPPRAAGRGGWGQPDRDGLPRHHPEMAARSSPRSKPVSR